MEPIILVPSSKLSKQDLEQFRGNPFVSLINIRPSLGNKGMEIQSGEVRARVARIVSRWLEIKP